MRAFKEHRDAPQPLELGGVGVVVEGAGDKHVELGVGGLAGGFHQVGARHGAKLGADEDGRALLFAGDLTLCVHQTLGIATFDAHQPDRATGSTKKS